MNKLIKKSKSKLMILLTIIISLTSLGFSTDIVKADNTLKLTMTDYAYTGTSPNTNTTLTHNIAKLSMDGKTVFCVESGVYTEDGGGYIGSTYLHSKKELLSQIVYYGYTATNKSDYDYSITQVMVWETLGDVYKSSNIPNYHAKKAEIMSKVNTHKDIPSWHNKEFSVEAGKSITIKDSNSVFNSMSLINNSTNTSLTKSGNDLTINADKNSKNGTISYQKFSSTDIGTSIVYKKPDKQTIAEFHLDSNVSAKLNLKVIHFGDLQIQKIDETTGKPIPNTIFKFEYDDVTKELITNSNGIAKIEHIKEGTKVTITEIKSAEGYFNKGEIKTFTIEPNKVIEVILDNKPQQGILNLTKLGSRAVSINVEESIYGEKNVFIFDDRPLAGATFEIKAREDIIIGNVLRNKAGEVVATLTSDEQGKVDCPKLYLGKYEIVETSSPFGFTFSKRPIEFELTYQDQYIEIVSKSMSIQNEFQKVKLLLHKNEEIIKSWKDNKPITDVIKANDKVFGVFTSEDIVIDGEIILEKDSLVEYGTVSNGELIFDNLNFPQGKFYFKELDAGLNHELDLHKYEFEFKADDNHSLKVIHVFDYYKEGSIEVLINKLHFNKISFKKLNENPILNGSDGYSFDFNGVAKGATFTLEDENHNILQTISIDDTSTGKLKNIPVGTFYLKEKSPSSNSYLPFEKVIKLESSKKGVKAYIDDKLIGEQANDEKDTPILFSIKNLLVKGTARLIKVDANTSKPLSGASISLLDSNKQTIISGKTNDEGFFDISNLPKGKYYFKELKSPDGYVLDGKAIEFEIKKQGETVLVEMENYKIGELPKTGDNTKSVIALSVFLLLSGFLTLAIAYKRKNNK